MVFKFRTKFKGKCTQIFCAISIVIYASYALNLYACTSKGNYGVFKLLITLRIKDCV